MALDDFEPQDAAPAPVPPAAKTTATEDEDLFDFPVVEMKFEAEVEKKRSHAPAPLAEDAPAPAAGMGSPSASAPAPAKPAAQPAKSAPVPGTAKAAVAAQAPAANGAKAPRKEIAQAAQLVEDIESVLGEDARRPAGARGWRMPSPAVLVVVGLLLLSNTGGLLFLWHTSHSFQNGVSAMNQQLVSTVQALRAETLAQNLQPAPANGAASAGSEDAHRHASVPLEAFERTSLSLAREEIQEGEYAAARRRLARLLAVADRIEAGQREEIEAQAAFLLAGTYRKQAEAAREEHP